MVYAGLGSSLGGFGVKIWASSRNPSLVSYLDLLWLGSRTFEFVGNPFVSWFRGYPLLLPVLSFCDGHRDPRSTGPPVANRDSAGGPFVVYIRAFLVVDSVR